MPTPESPTGIPFRDQETGPPSDADIQRTQEILEMSPADLMRSFESRQQTMVECDVLLMLTNYRDTLLGVKDNLLNLNAMVEAELARVQEEISRRRNTG